MTQPARNALGIALTLAVASLATNAYGQGASDLAGYFGFEDPRIIVAGDGAGPALAADYDGDGLTDLAVVNNRKSRIDFYTQRRSPRSQSEMEREYRVNKLPPNAWFDQVEVSIAHRIGAFRAYDYDGDGDLDIIYAGRPEEIVILEQTGPMNFEVAAKRRVRDLGPGQDGFDIADVMGDSEPELLTIVAGRIHIYELSDRGVTGEPVKLGSGGDLVAFFIEDYDGDGRSDVLGVTPEDSAPLRLWRQQRDPGGQGRLGAEIRFEMPAIREAEPARFPGRAAASIQVIERASRRIVMYDVVEDRIDPMDFSRFGGEVDALAEVRAFRNDDQDRGIAVGDLTGDGKPDLLATDESANSIVVYVQGERGGLGEGRAFGAFKEPDAVAIGQWDGDNANEVFVLSNEEKTVGVSRWNARTSRLEFPEPISLATGGAEPVAMGYLTLREAPALAVVARDGRDHTLEIHRPNADPVALELEGVNRPPNAVIGGDFDRDGRADVILFTPNEPMVMVRSVDGEAGAMVVLTDDDMPQFGLVQAAGPDNTAQFDIDGDRFNELLIADENFVRACTFDAEKGWRVVDQITMPEADASLAGLSVLRLRDRDLIVASDTSAANLVLMAEDGVGSWNVVRRLHLSGFDLGAIRTGAFHGRPEEPDVLCLSKDAFAFVRLAGQHVELEEFAAYRSDEDERLEHEAEFGDVNGDGFLDMIVLDAREQMCQVFTFSETRRLYFATEFEVFQSRLFRGGDTREFEPSAAIIADFTGDGANDLCLAVHDRFIILPQTGRPR